MLAVALAALGPHKVGTTTGRLHPKPEGMPEGLDLSPADLKALDYWTKRTDDNELHPFKDIIVKTNLALVSYDPLLYPGVGQCAKWCYGEIHIDMDAAGARNRHHYPASDIVDWTEKCSWDGMCGGCPQCEVDNNNGITCVAFCQILTSDSLTAPWKQQTLNWTTACAWGPCHGCDECSATAKAESQRVEDACKKIATKVNPIALEHDPSTKTAEIAYKASCAAIADGASVEQGVVVYTAAAAAASAGELAGFNDADMAASGHAAGTATWTSWKALQKSSDDLAPAIAGAKTSAVQSLKGMPPENALAAGSVAAAAIANGHTPEEARALGEKGAAKPSWHAPEASPAETAAARRLRGHRSE